MTTTDHAAASAEARREYVEMIRVQAERLAAEAIWLGDIVLGNEPGRGSTFTVVLPAEA